MKKIILSSLVTVIIVAAGILAAAGYFIGDYFVNFALRRGNNLDSNAPPQALTVAFAGQEWYKKTAVPRPRAASEDWQLTSRDGLKLAATHFEPAQMSHQWVILVHGYGCNQTYMWNMARAYLRNGYQVLTPDLRASGQSEGLYITMGARESDDLALWAAQIAREDPEARIVLHGVSMGAAAVLLASAQTLPPQVAALVEDSGYTTAYAMFASQMQSLFNLPASPLLDCANYMAQKRTGVKFTEASPLAAVRRTHLPTLFIHGAEDRMVPPAMMQELYNASAAPVKEELVISKAGHAMAYVVDPNTYFTKVFAFTDKYTG